MKVTFVISKEHSWYLNVKLQVIEMMNLWVLGIPTKAKGLCTHCRCIQFSWGSGRCCKPLNGSRVKLCARKQSHKSSRSSWKLYFNRNCARFYMKFKPTKENKSYLFWTTACNKNSCFLEFLNFVELQFYYFF